MKISAKLHYGVIILTRLAQEESVLSAKEIAKIEGLPQSYVGKLMKEMRKRDILVSEKGRGKGYRLKKPASKITIGQVAKALGENLDLVLCLSPEDLCPKAGKCKSEKLWKIVQKSINNVLNKTTLQNLIEK